MNCYEIVMMDLGVDMKLIWWITLDRVEIINWLLMFLSCGPMTLDEGRPWGLDVLT